jgi:hypothetical protein
MVIITVAAVVLGLVMIMNNTLLSILAAFMWCVLPTPLLIYAVFGRGSTRAFAIGGLVPWVQLMSNRIASPELARLFWLSVMTVVCGGVAVVTYRWVQRD